jgi:hypothetical protein
MQDIATFLKIGHEYQPIPKAETIDRLPSGIYNVKFDPRNEMVAFAESKTTHDDLVDLPGTAYDEVLSELEYFLTDECFSRHKKVGLLHKMNILLFGPPGTGKTCIVNRVAHRTIQEGGLVLFNPPPQSLREVFRILDKFQPDTRVLVIFEELDQQINSYGEDPFLHILDGEVQKANAMFIATTNYINKIPARIRRPGRFAVRVEVGYPSFEARKFYCMRKLEDESLSTAIASLTENFSIDQLKEVIRSHYCMKKPLDRVVSSLRSEFQIPEALGQSQSYDNDDEDDEEWDTEDDIGYQLSIGQPEKPKKANR